MTATEATTGAENVPEGEQPKQQEQSFTQADVDRIVKERLGRETAKYADYDDLKAAAGKSQTLEQRIGTLESELSSTKADALRTRIASKFGISTEKGSKDEPSDADLFLTGTDEATLTAQAERLAARVADRKKQGNVAPKEGETTNSGDASSDIRDFTRSLFGESE